ncbi:MAG: translation initiation factor 2 [Lachnospiraceae bacterium]|nr:translation initiation factor 2 [Lachnospiraceae bacterium]
METKRLRYEFDIKRNITVILGDSATGKTTMVELLSAYGRFGENGGIKLESDVPCVVFAATGEKWQSFFVDVEDSIVFIDEDHPFVFGEEFARYACSCSHYFVIITRRPLFNLPYSIDEVYGIKTTGRYHFPEKVYHEFYHIYDNALPNTVNNKYTFLLEDSGSGLDFYRNAFGDSICRSAGGNSGIAKVLSELDTEVVVIADGAAFGAYMDGLLSVAENKTNVILYLPESFEWLILKSGIIMGENLDRILAHPEEYIDSKEYFSWERYFTSLLMHITENDPVRRYSKVKLLPFYSTGKNREAIIAAMPEPIRRLYTKD